METIEEIRHANLHLLAARGHSQAAIGRAVGVDRRQVNQWFVTPPLRNLSSEYARAIEDRFVLTRGCMDHPQLGEGASQPARLDTEILLDAIRLAMASEAGLTAENVANSYLLLLERLTPPKNVSGIPADERSGAARHGTVKRRDQGAVEDSGRKGGPGKKGAA